MFKKIRRYCSGARPHSTLLGKSLSWFGNLLKSELAPNSPYKYFKDDPDLREDWIEFYSDILREIADVNNRQEQIIALRKATMEAVEHTNMVTPIFLSKYSDDEKTIILNYFYKDMPVDEQIDLNFYSYIYSSANIFCLRMLLLEDKGSKENSWYDLFHDTHAMYVESLYNAITSNDNDKSLNALFIEKSGELYKEYKSKILEGYIFEYDREKNSKA